MLVGPTMRRRRLGADLRRLREARSLRLEEVAARLGVVPSTLSRIETGKAPTRVGYLSIMLDLYGVTDPAHRQTLADLAREGHGKGWWAEYEDVLPAGGGTYLGLESAARSVLAFAAQAVPGLLQTPDYARAMVAAARPELTPVQADRLVTAQLRRQQVLGDGEPGGFRFVLDESVLVRRLGSAAIMRGQLERVAELAAHPAVVLQVLSLATADRPLPAGPFAVLTFTGPAGAGPAGAGPAGAGPADIQPGDSDVVCAEGIRGQFLLADRDADVRPARQTFDALSRCALAPQRSADLVARLTRRC